MVTALTVAIVFAYIGADEGRTPDVVATTVSHDDVVLEADDCVVIRRAALFVDDDLRGEDDRAPLGWTAPKPTSGEYALQIFIQDAQGITRASNIVEVTIGRTTSKTDASGALPGGYGRGGDDVQGCNLGASSGSSGFGSKRIALPLLCASRRRYFA